MIFAHSATDTEAMHPQTLIAPDPSTPVPRHTPQRDTSPVAWRLSIPLVLATVTGGLLTCPALAAALAYHVDTGQGYAPGGTGGQGLHQAPDCPPACPGCWVPQVGSARCWVDAAASPHPHRLRLVLGSLLLAEAVVRGRGPRQGSTPPLV